MVTFAVVFVEESSNHHFDDARFTARMRATGLLTNALKGSSERQARYGVGLGMRFHNTELDVAGIFSTNDQTSGVMLTLGQVFYGRTLGNGKRRAFNPYMTLRAGYANLDRNYLVIGSELGVELLKAKGVLLAVGVGPTGLIGDDSQLAVEANASLGVAF